MTSNVIIGVIIFVVAVAIGAIARRRHDRNN